ncbi:hypothetical protein XA68_17338 [Ophiocordyceps unilateralis]|uniref:Uncharacterized protein n=1 Tax=Ophiocordyceps unilateralis TaxID=268505 RepID=A0A2A9P384_OPHUN|nr:hypothetical protein XA68_17338 [Ophiocordyceps unilateralis]
MQGPDDKHHGASPELKEADKLTTEEVAALLQESLAIKAEANALFSSRDYHNALARYDDALASCPRHLAFDRAVLLSNVAAAHLQLEQWTEAIKAASDALDALDGEDKPTCGATSEKGSVDDKPPEPADDPTADEEIISTGAQSSASQPTPPSPSTRKSDTARIRTKALLRRARARSQAGGWQNLAGAEEDYRALAAIPVLTPVDARTVRDQLKALPPRTKAAQEAEMSEMWGKLRNLGDGILRPFGLSTQNFQMGRLLSSSLRFCSIDSWTVTAPFALFVR